MHALYKNQEINFLVTISSLNTSVSKRAFAGVTESGSVYYDINGIFCIFASVEQFASHLLLNDDHNYSCIDTT